MDKLTAAERAENEELPNGSTESRKATGVAVIDANESACIAVDMNRIVEAVDTALKKDS